MNSEDFNIIIVSDMGSSYTLVETLDGTRCKHVPFGVDAEQFGKMNYKGNLVKTIFDEE